MKALTLVPTILCLLSAIPLRADHFTYERAKEAAEHAHYAVVFEKGHGEEAVGHLPVLIIRTRGDYRDISTRAKYIAERLNTALDFLQQGAGLKVVQEGSEWSIFVFPSQAHRIRVLRVHPGDVAGELRRCKRQVDSQLLARYWMAWLEDFTELFIRHRMPSNLTNTHTGLVLKLIYTQARTLGDGVVDEESIHESVDLLADNHWHRLNDLAGCVVEEFK